MRTHRRFTRTLARLSVCALSATSLALAAVTATATASPVSPKTAVPTSVTPAGSPHKAALADPVTVPSPGDGTSVAVLDSSPRYSARTNMDIETVNTKFAEIVKHFNDDETTEQALEDRATSLNTKVEAHTKADVAVSDQVKQHNAKVDALQARIDAHNAEPHTFELPDQQAAADAYQAEANELNAEKNTLNAEGSSIRAEQTKVDNEETSLSTEKDQLQKDIDTFSQALTTLQNDERQLENQRLNVLQEMAADLENLAAQQFAAPSRFGDILPQESPGASEMAQGGDAARPADESDPSAQPGRAPQPDPAMDATAGGDMPSRSSQNTALDDYARRHNVTVIEQPATVQLSPQAVRSLSPTQAGQISLTNTYQGFVREPSGNYKAIQVLTLGSAFGPGERAFDDAIAGGARATTLIDGRTVIVDAVGTLIDAGPAPQPQGQGTPAPSTSTEENQPPKDCTQRKPAGAQDLPNKGWVVYQPLGDNGRAQGMEACLVGYDPTQMTNPTVNPVGWDAAVDRGAKLIPNAKQNPVARCHFLAARFGGSNNDPRNFTACWQNPVNDGDLGMSRYEKDVVRALSPPSRLIVDFTEKAVYDTPASDTPAEYELEAYGQVPNSDEIIPLGMAPIQNDKVINGTPYNLGN